MCPLCAVHPRRRELLFAEAPHAAADPDSAARDGGALGLAHRPHPRARAVPHHGRPTARRAHRRPGHDPRLPRAQVPPRQLRRDPFAAQRRPVRAPVAGVQPARPVLWLGQHRARARVAVPARRRAGCRRRRARGAPGARERHAQRRAQRLLLALRRLRGPPQPHGDGVGRQHAPAPRRRRRQWQRQRRRRRVEGCECAGRAAGPARLASAR